MKLFLLILIATSALLVLTVANCTTESNLAESLPTPDEPKKTITKNAKRTPVLVELFTSEGCSSCPPADQTLALLLREQPFAEAEIVALSQHVDYWNRLGWADPFSDAQFSQRQGEYSAFFGKNGDVYTPQMIVDGTREFVGSNMREAQKAITEAAKAKKADVNLSVKRDKDTVSFDIKIENLPDSFESAIVLLAIAEDDLASSVSRGENAGQKLTHVAVTRSLTNIGAVKAGQKSFALQPIMKLHKDWKIKNLNAIVFVQDLKSRQVLGISKIILNQ